MTRASNLHAALMTKNIAILPGAIELLGRGLESSLQDNNEKALADFDIDGGSGASEQIRVLADPQTAGGLLASMPQATAGACVNELVSEGYAYASIVGEVFCDGPSRIELSN